MMFSHAAFAQNDSIAVTPKTTNTYWLSLGAVGQLSTAQFNTSTSEDSYLFINQSNSPVAEFRIDIDSNVFVEFITHQQEAAKNNFFIKGYSYDITFHHYCVSIGRSVTSGIWKPYATLGMGMAVTKKATQQGLTGSYDLVEEGVFPAVSPTANISAGVRIPLAPNAGFSARFQYNLLTRSMDHDADQLLQFSSHALVFTTYVAL